jgi:Ca2+-binding EF-hand superfamily protein
VAGKLRLAFQSPHEVFRFFDLLHQAHIRKEHFWFCVSTFNMNLRFEEILHLFDSLDGNRDGQID